MTHNLTWGYADSALNCQRPTVQTPITLRPDVAGAALENGPSTDEGNIFFEKQEHGRLAEGRGCFKRVGKGNSLG